jgi:ubiquinone/menaquinone biosynthesis C-methylase UbiE
MIKNVQNRSETYDKGRKGYSRKLIKTILTMNPQLELNQYVDVGCGTGALTIPIGRKFKKVYASDISKDRIDFCVNKHKKLKHIKFITASAEVINLKDKSVDLITSAQSFMYFDREKFYQECTRVLKCKGVLAITWKYPNRPNPILDLIDECVNKTRKQFKTDLIHASRNPIPFVRGEKIISELTDHEFTQFKYEEIKTEYIFNKDDLCNYAFHSNGFAINNVGPEIENHFKTLLFKQLPGKKEFRIPFYEFIYLAVKH